MRDRPKVGEILVQAGIIDELQLASALGEQSRWGRRLGMTLIKLGMVQEGHLVRALARQYDLPVASLAGKKIAPEVIALVPAKLAIEHSVVPLFVKKEGHKSQLFLGMEEPSDLGILDDLAFHTGMSIRPVMVGPTELGEAIDRYYAARPTTPASPRLPDPMRGADTLSEQSLRSLRDEAAPRLSELLKPGPMPASESTEPAAPVAAPATPAAAVAPAPVVRAALSALDATPLVPAVPETEVENEPETDTQPLAVSPIAPVLPVASAARTEPGATVAGIPAATPVIVTAPAPADAPVASATTASPAPVATVHDVGSAEVARAIEETERTRLVAKAIAHLLIEKGLLTLEELQARIEKMKSARPGTSV